MTKLTLAIPSKGRLMEQTTDMFARAGLIVRKVGHVRGYRGEIDGLPGIDVAYVSSSEIAEALKAGSVHLGITGEDMIRENISDSATRIRFVQKLGFGFADVVVAVPGCWIDVATVADLEEIAIPFRRLHGRWPRVATKYVNLHAALLRHQRLRRLPHHRKRGSDRRRACRWHRRADRRYHDDG